MIIGFWNGENWTQFNRTTAITIMFTSNRSRRSSSSSSNRRSTGTIRDLVAFETINAFANGSRMMRV